MPESRKYSLPRLDPVFYQGDAVVHWNLTVFDRATGWLSDSFQHRFRELMLHAASREGLFCPVYCLMRDHLHLVWMGLRPESDQRNGMAFLRTYLEPALAPCEFQPQAYDHVLRDEERLRHAFAKVCWYIVENPLRKELVKHPKDCPYIGAIVSGYPNLHPLQDDYWPKFWKLYVQHKDPKASHRQLPLRTT